MAESIPDTAIVAVLRPFVRASGPLLDRLREADPFGDRLGDRLARVRMPGTTAWRAMSPQARTDWWVNRVGRFTTIVAAVPGLGGALANRLPVTEAVGAAGQGLLLCAIAGEYGVTDVPSRVRMLAAVLFGRNISEELASGAHTDRAAEDERTAELRERAEQGGRRRGNIRTAAGAVYRLGRALLSVPGELERRPRGRWYHRAAGMIPVAGAAANYLGERSGLKRAARAAVRWLRENGHTSAQ